MGDRVEDEEAAEALRVVDGPVQAVQSPVMRYQSRIPQVERLQELLRPFGMTPDLERLGPVRLVGAPGPEEVGNDHPVAGLKQRRDEVAVDVAPRRVAVYHHDWGRITRPLVNVMKPAVCGLVPVRLVWPRAT